MSGVLTDIEAGNSYIWKSWKIFVSRSNHRLYFQSEEVIVELPEQSYGYFLYILDGNSRYMSPFNGPMAFLNVQSAMTNLQRSVGLVDPSMANRPVEFYPELPYLMYGDWIIKIAEEGIIITNNHSSQIAKELKLTLPAYLSGFTFRSASGETSSHGEAIL